MQAIITKYHGASNTRGSYISAKCEALSIRFPCADELDIDDNHRAACRELCKRMDDGNVKKYGTDARTWSRAKVSGQIPNGEHVHVFTKSGGVNAAWE